jgi:hypothetical protein
VGYSYASFEAWELARVGGDMESPMNLVDHITTVEQIIADGRDGLSTVTEQIIWSDKAFEQLEPKDV